MERIEAAAGIKRHGIILPLGVFNAREITTQNNKTDGQQHFLKREVKVYNSLIFFTCITTHHTILLSSFQREGIQSRSSATASSARTVDPEVVTAGGLG